MSFEIVCTPKAVGHLAALRKSEQVTIVDQVDQLLVHEPLLAIRRRKQLRPNPIAFWELRIGEFRVFYDVGETPTPNVIVKAIGKKVHDELWIGSERITL